MEIKPKRATTVNAFEWHPLKSRSTFVKVLLMFMFTCGGISLFLRFHSYLQKDSQMLQPILHQLKTKSVILASGSPRRQELIKNLGLDVQLCPSLFQENLDPKAFPNFGAFVEETAYQKVLEVHERLASEVGVAPDIVIGADTMVTLGDKLYGKPKTGPVAFQMLSELIGRKHTVYTGVAIKYGEKVARFTESTDVYFGKASPEQIQAYVDTGEPLDKAGGYGIQGVGACLVERIEGDYFTVVGLPLYRLCMELLRLFDHKI